MYSSSQSTTDPLTSVLILTYVVAGIMLIFALIALWIKHQMQERGVSFPEFVSTYIKEGKRKTGIRFLRVPDGMTFGKTRSGKFACSPSDREGHALVLGTSGSGKTSAVIIPSLRHWRGHAYVIDLGDIADNVPRASPRIVYRPAESDKVKYNVFARIDRAETDDQKQELLEELAYTLLPEATGTESAERFFSEEGRKMLTAALLAYYRAGKDFPEICEWIAENNWRDLLNDIVKTCDKDPRIIRYISSFAGANEKNNQGCKQSVDRALKLFATNEFVKRSLGRGPQSFSPADLEERDIYVQIPAEKLTLYAPLLSLLSTDVMETFTDRDPSGRQRILLCLDEAGTLFQNGSLWQAYLKTLRLGRKHGINTLVASQSLNDFTLIGGKTALGAMLDNISITALLGLGSSDMEGQRYFSDLAGTVVSKDGSSRQFPRFPPQVLAGLQSDLILFYAGKAVRLNKSFYFSERKRGFI